MDFWDKLKYFTKQEFQCPCCGEVHMDMEFMFMLDAARDQAGVPFHINSGYRCAKHDNALGGKGNHTTGKAADISALSSRGKFLIVTAALDVGINRIGIGSTFIHLDFCTEEDGKPSEVLWIY